VNEELKDCHFMEDGFYINELQEDIKRLKEQLNDEIDDELKQSEIMVKQQNEIERLNKGYCELKEKCNKGDCDCTNEEYNSMCEENIKMDLEIERLNKGINEIIQYINLLELGSDHEETYNKDGYLVDVYDIEKMLVELIGSDKE